MSEYIIENQSSSKLIDEVVYKLKRAKEMEAYYNDLTKLLTAVNKIEEITGLDIMSRIKIQPKNNEQ